MQEIDTTGSETGDEIGTPLADTRGCTIAGKPRSAREHRRLARCLRSD
jgi:hypothetical protein